MKHVYACLTGRWVNLSAEPTCVIGSSMSSPNTWWEEEGPDMFKYDYINLSYQNIDYRIHPSFIQIVTE